MALDGYKNCAAVKRIDAAEAEVAAAVAAARALVWALPEAVVLMTTTGFEHLKQEEPVFVAAVDDIVAVGVVAVAEGGLELDVDGSMGGVDGGLMVDSECLLNEYDDFVAVDVDLLLALFYVDADDVADEDCGLQLMLMVVVVAAAAAEALDDYE